MAIAIGLPGTVRVGRDTLTGGSEVDRLASGDASRNQGLDPGAVTRSQDDTIDTIDTLLTLVHSIGPAHGGGGDSIAGADDTPDPVPYADHNLFG